MIIKRFAYAALALTALSALPPSAHDAITIKDDGAVAVQNYSGYKNCNNLDCCNNSHCHPLPSSRYSVAPNGTVIIKRLPEGNLSLALKPSDPLIATSPSTDGQYHECTSDGKGGGAFYCLIKPDEKMAQATSSGPVLAGYAPDFSNIRARLTSLLARNAAPQGPICTGSR